ncbi:MAG: cytochrome c3 family protein [Bacteroidota bacterium]
MNRLLFLILIGILSLSFIFLNQSEISEKKCTDCHGKLIEQEVIHASVEACDNCHQATGKEHPQSNVKGFILSEKVPLLCYSCHDEKNIKKNVHPPLKDGNCMTCHSAHASSEEKLLLLEGRKLCLNCHNKSTSKEGEKVSNIKQLLKKSKIIHGVIEGDGCVPCHNPHDSENPFLLISPFPVGNYAPAKIESFALCFNCHDSELLEIPITQTATNFRNGDKNLHYIHINGNKGRNCNNCHNVHGSLHEHLIADKVPFGNWEMRMNFILQENGGSCLPGCHAEKKYQR